MIFQYTWAKILLGEKTQTRRIFKPGDYGWICGHISETERGFYYSSVNNQQGDKIFNRWTVGKTYAAQPGRGQKSVGRIEIVGIRREDVRNISLEDVKAEGFSTKWDFWRTWIQIHDPKFLEDFVGVTYDHSERIVPVNLMEQPSEWYKAWVLEFKLVEVE